MSTPPDKLKGLNMAGLINNHNQSSKGAQSKNNPQENPQKERAIHSSANRPSNEGATSNMTSSQKESREVNRQGDRPEVAVINSTKPSHRDQPSSNVFANIMNSVIEANPEASDFLIKEGNPVWIRTFGKLIPSNSQVISKAMLKDFIINSAPKTQLSWDSLEKELEAKGDADFAVDINKIRFRFNYYKSNGSRHCMAMRKLPESPVPLENLGLSEKFSSLLHQEKGLILVTGPTGSGKTTTLASAIDYLNKRVNGHIITLEDPVEYIIKSDKCLVDQREIGKDTKDFKSGLRSALRQDPDILLVGELRDQETVKVALDAATTGHLVLGTLHTNSALQTIERLTSFFSDDRKDWAHEVLAQVLLGISSQVLIKRHKEAGRVMASEIMIATPAIRSHIRGRTTKNIFNEMDTGAKDGQVLMNRALVDLIKNNIISVADAKYSTYDLKAFELEMNRA